MSVKLSEGHCMLTMVWLVVLKRLLDCLPHVARHINGFGQLNATKCDGTCLCVTAHIPEYKKLANLQLRHEAIFQYKIATVTRGAANTRSYVFNIFLSRIHKHRQALRQGVPLERAINTVIDIVNDRFGLVHLVVISLHICQHTAVFTS